LVAFLGLALTFSGAENERISRQEWLDRASDLNHPAGNELVFQQVQNKKACPSPIIRWCKITIHGVFFTKVLDDNSNSFAGLNAISVISQFHVSTV
jgi:hypothetical protein